jgi:hypothetical protein
MFLTAALYGVMWAVSAESAASSQAFLTFTLVTVTLIFFWCRFDAAARKASLPPWNQALIIAVALVGVPVYFFRTMPWREATLATLKAAAVLLATSIVSGACTVIARGIAT